jgi:8-oxo-dGTP pyrophosphatase MutT (NUDIX family)
MRLMQTPRTMITFRSDQTRFTYRIAGILIHRGHVLCQMADRQGFWFLPGGRAELGESAKETLFREMQEELGIDVKVERLVYIIENFFTHAGGSSEHEIALYFLMTAPDDAYLYQSLETFMHEDEMGNHLRFDWLPIARLEEFRLYPSVLQKLLREIPRYTVHIEEHGPRE